MIDKVLEQLQGLSKVASDEGNTVEELVVKSGHSVRWVRERLREAKARDMLVVGTRTGERLDGIRCRTPVYSIKE